MRFFQNNNIADSLFFSSHKRKNGSLRQTLHPFKQTTGKESISRFPPTCAASARDPKLALDFVLDDARVFLCGDLAVHDPGQPGPGHRRGHHGRSPTARHPREEDFLPSASRGLERAEEVPGAAGEGLCGGVRAGIGNLAGFHSATWCSESHLAGVSRGGFCWGK